MQPTTDKRQRAVISDLGNVFVRVDMTPVKRYLAGASGLDPDEAWKILWEDLAWVRHERGEISTAELVREGGLRLGAELAEDAFTDAWCSIFPGLEEGIDRVFSDVRSRAYKLVAFSNTNEPHLGYLTRCFAEMSLFERVFASHEMGMRKPEPESFIHVARELGLEPGECVFIDDLPENCDAARGVGMQSILATGTHSVRNGLSALGILEENS